MKIAVIQENFAKALQLTSKAVSTRPNIPVLANVLLEAEKGKIKLSTTNLEMGISTWIGGNVGKEGKITVSSKLLSEFITSLKPGKIEMYEVDQMFEVKYVDNVAQFFVIPADDFPKVPVSEGEPLFEMNALEFADAVLLTAFCASTDESRPVLTGVLMNVKEKVMTLVGVDGFRLSKKIINLEKTIKKENFNEIIPAKTLLELEKIIRDVADKKSNIQVFYLGAKNQLLFKVGDIELSTRLIEGEFPDYEKIIPSEKSLSFNVKREDFLEILKIVFIFARNVIGNKVKYVIDSAGKKLKLSASVVDVGKNENEIEIDDLRGDDYETGYNVKYLMDMVQAIKSKQIIFQSNGPTAPGVFLNPEDKDFIHLVMPMRLD